MRREKRKYNQSNKRSKIDKLLEIPDEVVSDVPKLTIVSFNEVLIENYKSILEYQDYYIRINTSIGVVNINGYDLELSEMTTDDLMVRGKIESVDIETIVD